MSIISFTDEEKIMYFDKIASNYYNKNFGKMSKSDFELLLFHIYLEKLQSTNKYADGSIDYSKSSDYRISKDLGITQQKVRNLKINNQLIYPAEYDWKLAFSKLLENARYDKITGKIVMNIPDPSLFLDIQDFIEENGAFVEKQLNSKILQIRVEYFVDLLISIEPEHTRKEIINELKSLFKENGKDENSFIEKNIGKSLIDNALNITTVLSNIGGLVSSGNFIISALQKVLN